MASEAKSEGLVFHPMDQFIVKPFFGSGSIEFYTFTNAAFWMLTSVVMVIVLLVLATSRRSIVPSRTQSVAELAYGFVYKMVEDVAGKDGVAYFPYIMTLFMFIVCANFAGLLPMSFTTTSHIAVTAVMAMLVFLSVTILGFVKNGASFLSLFWISSAPLPLRPILALIEVISYFVRPISHSIRLAGNMMAGHAVIKVFRCVRWRCTNCTVIYRSNHCNLRAGSAGFFHTSVCVRNLNLCVSQGCTSPSPLITKI